MRDFFSKVLGFVGVLLIMGVSLLMGIFSSMLVLQRVPLELTEIMVANYSGTFGVVVASIVISLIMRQKVVENDRLKKCWKIDYRLIIIALLSVIVLKILFSSMVGIIAGFVYPTEPYVSEKSIMFDYFLGIVIAPISEEFLFRFGLYNYAKSKMPKCVAIVVISVIFSLVHGFRIDSLIEIFVAGLLFNIVYEKTGNIWYNIACHMFCNIFANVSNILVDSGVNVFTEPHGYVIYNIFVVIIAFVFGAGIIYVLKKGSDRVQNTCS